MNPPSKAIAPKCAASVTSGSDDEQQPPPPTDGGDGKPLTANGHPVPSTAGRSCGFELGRLPRNGATAAMAEGVKFGAAEAVVNGEQGTGGATAIFRLLCVPPVQ